MPASLMPFLAEIPLELSPEDWALMPNAWIAGVVYFFLLMAGLGADALMLSHLRGIPFQWTIESEQLKFRAWPSRDFLRLVLWLVLLHLSAMTVFQFLYAHDALGDESAPKIVFIQSIIFHWAGLALAAVMLVHRRVSARSAFGLDWKRAALSTGRGFYYYLGALPVVLIGALLAQYFLVRMGMKPELQDIAGIVAGDYVWWVRAYLYLLAVVLAPVFEEVLFRGIALPWMARRTGMPAAVVMVSLVFAAVHGYLFQMIPLFIIATAFSLAYIRTGNLLVPIVMHSVFNGINTILLVVLQSGAGE